MPEAVIVATGRTPIGRANKGSLVDCRPDDLAALVIREVLAKVPQLDPQSVEDVIMGSGQPGGEAGLQRRAGRRAAGRTTRRARGDRQPLLLVLPPDHPDGCPCHPGRRGRRVRRRRGGDGQPLPQRRRRHRPAQRAVRRRRGPHRRADAGRPVSRGPLSPGLPDVYIAMGQTAENVAEFKKVSREEQDEFALQSQTRAVAAQESGFFEREIIPVTTPNGDRGDQGRRATARHHPRGSGQPQAGVPRGGHGHRRQRLPAQRRCRRGHRDERHQGPRARHHPARPHRGQRGHRAQSRDHGARARSTPSARPWRGPT